MGKRMTRGPQFYSTFGSMPPVDKEAAKKWVDKAFDLASEFNGDFAPNSKERQANDEILRKSRKWAEQFMQSADVLSETTETDTKTEGESSSSSSKTDGDFDWEPVTETPKMENASDEDTFRVAVDLPGVEKVDVDVTVEDEFLIVKGTRSRRRRAERQRRSGQGHPQVLQENRLRRKRSRYGPNGGDLRERRFGSFGSQKEGGTPAGRTEASNPDRLNKC